MGERLKETGHIRERAQICPKCGAKESIVHQHVVGKQRDLFGRASDVWSRLRYPACNKCNAWFPRGQKFDEVR